jgi:hypothetical protein
MWKRLDGVGYLLASQAEHEPAQAASNSLHVVPRISLNRTWVELESLESLGRSRHGKVSVKADGDSDSDTDPVGGGRS